MSLQFRRGGGALLLAAAFLFSATRPAHAQQPAESQSAPTQPTAAVREIRIGSGDLLEVKVFGVPEMDQVTRVAGGGEIIVSLVGRVTVGGLTPEAAQAAIESRLKDGGYVRDPHVTVFIREYATQGVTVLGEVDRPGVYPVIGPRRLYDVISLAGGTTDKAGKRVSITRREKPEAPITVELNSDPTKSLESNLEIVPGDTVVVSKAGVVYVVGDVARPSGFTMENNERMTVLQAIALAGGVNGSAAAGKSKIIRRNSAGKLEEIEIPLNKILSAQYDDLLLQPEDIVFVPNSKAKGAARRGMESVVAIATGLAIYRR